MGNKVWKQSEREDILNRTDGRCAYCGKPVGSRWHVDHKIPVNQGGTNDPDNLLPACIKCNKLKAGRTPDQFKEALIKRLGRTLITFRQQFSESLVYSRSPSFSAIEQDIDIIKEEIEFSIDHSPLIFWFEKLDCLDKGT